MSERGAWVFVTGCTGFLGKVVLAELLRRERELGIAGIFVLVRPRGSLSAEQRFERLAASDAFRALPDGWQSRCRVVSGDIACPGLGLTPADRREVITRATHVVHCAAAIEFDLPLADAARANITGALEVLELARTCKSLASMVSVSTAYVWPPPEVSGSFGESLVPLPLDPEAVYQSILCGRGDARALLSRTGHVNTYTFTKCLAEHLLVARRGAVPLRIVRPSIISACRARPFAGWIDSVTSFTGMVALYAGDALRVVAIEPECRPDIVPCDDVADRVLHAAFRTDVPPGEAPIRYAVAGPGRSARAEDVMRAVLGYFERYPTGPRLGLRHFGAMSARVRLLEWPHHRARMTLRAAALTVAGRHKLAASARGALRVMLYMNRGFNTFTHRSFVFEASDQHELEPYEPLAYQQIICEGVHRHVMKLGPDAVPVAGAHHRDGRGDARRPRDRSSDGVMNALGAVVRAGLCRVTDLVTFDQAALESALASAEPGALPVLVASHRSYLDFVVVPFLCFARPDLRLAPPHVAAAEDFARIPLLSPLLRRGGAFFLRRGVRREDGELTEQIARIARSQRPLLFFLEGTRSRSRRMLAPKRGLLRALQSSGRACALVPVKISYERVPEEREYARELRGASKSPESLRGLVRWGLDALRGRVSLGRVHVGFGRAHALDASSEVAALSAALAAELQRSTTVTTYHLRCFLESTPVPGVSAVRLRRLVEARGVKVFESKTKTDGARATGELCLRQQWIHAFYRDVAHLAGANPAIAHHLAAHDFVRARGPGAAPRALLAALFVPLCDGYASTARFFAARAPESPPVAAAEVARALPAAFGPDVSAAIEDLLERGLVARGRGGLIASATPREFESYARACAFTYAEAPEPRTSSRVRAEGP